jgi:hypothetical protein
MEYKVVQCEGENWNRQKSLTSVENYERLEIPKSLPYKYYKA